MATEDATPALQSASRRPDGQYAFVVGLYVASYLASILVLALDQFVSDAAILYVGFLVAVALVTAIAGFTVSRIRGVAIYLGGKDRVWGLVALPFTWLLGVYAATASGVDVPGLALPVAVIGTAGGMATGLMIVTMSRSRHAIAHLDGAVDLAEWDARWPETWRKFALGIVLFAFTASTLGLVAAFLFGVSFVWRLYYLLFVGAVLMNVLNPRTFRATDKGLVIEHPLQRQLRPWSAYSGFEVSETTLTIRPRKWWRPAHRCDRSDIEDLDNIVEALEGTL